MRKLFIPVAGSFLPAACGKTDLTCSSSTILESLVTCISMQMPERESSGYVALTSTQRADWRIVVNQMLQGSSAVLRHRATPSDSSISNGSEFPQSQRLDCAHHGYVPMTEHCKRRFVNGHSPQAHGCII